jgi:hypothetical protein
VTPRGQGGDRTFETIRSRYDAWAEDRSSVGAGASSWTPSAHEPQSAMPRMIIAAIGVGLGLVLLILAALSAWTAAQWAEMGREPAVIGYILITVFLCIAAIGAIAGSLNHAFRVLDPSRREAHAHL